MAIAVVMGVFLVIGLLFVGSNAVKTLNEKRVSTVVPSPTFSPTPTPSPKPVIGPKVKPSIHALRPYRRVANRSQVEYSRYMKITSYCDTGNPMANGQMPYVGAAATLDRSIPFGTVLVTSFGSYVVKDRIGNSSDLDIFTHSCAQARQFGVHYERVSFASR